MIRLRNIELSDAPTLYRWRLDETTVANSMTQHIFTGQTHIGWMVEEMAKGNPHQMAVQYYTDVPVGVLYLTAHRKANDAKTIFEDAFIAGLLVAPEHRGKGYAKQILTSGINRATGKRNVYAQIRTGNVASIRTFESCGFELIDEDVISRHYKWSNPNAKPTTEELQTPSDERSNVD